MAEFKLGRLRFVWKSDWVTGTTYFKDDIVAYGGKTFLCVVGHTAAADFYTNLDNIPTKWNQFSDGQDWKGNWGSSTLYKINDIVKYGGYLYICNDGHTSSSTLEANQGDWDIFAESFDWQNAWTTGYVQDILQLPPQHQALRLIKPNGICSIKDWIGKVHGVLRYDTRSAIL